MTKRVIINIEEADFAHASETAKQQGISFAALMRLLLKKYLRSHSKTLDKMISN